MLMLIRDLFKILSPGRRRQFYFLQVFVILMVFMQLISVAAIAPFMVLVGDIDILNGDGLLAKIYKFSKLENPYDFLILVGGGVLMVMACGSLLSVLTIWRLSSFASSVSAEMAEQLYRYYMQKNWLFHAQNSSAHLIKQVSSETNRVANYIIEPLMLCNSNAVIVFAISLGLLILNPLVALIGIGIFSSSYVLIFIFVRKRLYRNGHSVSRISMEKFRLMTEGFGGIKDVLLLGRSQYFSDQFHATGRIYARAEAVNNTLGLMPRYVLELIAFTVMLSLVVVVVRTQGGDLANILPILSIYALAGFKLLPSVQQLYVQLTKIKSNSAAFESIKDDLMNAIETSEQHSGIDGNFRSMGCNKKIVFENVSFSYPNKKTLALSDVSLSIPAKTTVGIVGASGSGKSTMIDLLLGLISPDQGRVVIDDISLNDINMRDWQNSIGFVPQNIFLSDRSLAENIAFGVPSKLIDMDKVVEAAFLSQLDDFVKSLPMGFDTCVGERGIQLSGGQRQRIGIARALYHGADVLIFDEATSALDGITEKLIMEAINTFSGNKTIILVAHRLKTVERCDIIFLLSNGSLVDQGSYQELFDNNDLFRRMASNS